MAQCKCRVCTLLRTYEAATGAQVGPQSLYPPDKPWEHQGHWHGPDKLVSGWQTKVMRRAGIVYVCLGLIRPASSDVKLTLPGDMLPDFESMQTAGVPLIDNSGNVVGKANLYDASKDQRYIEIKCPKGAETPECSAILSWPCALGG